MAIRHTAAGMVNSEPHPAVSPALDFKNAGAFKSSLT
jgi:hypothetical protein